MNKIVWKDKNGNCKCESCGKIVPEDKLNWHKNMAYCSISVANI